MPVGSVPLMTSPLLRPASEGIKGSWFAGSRATCVGFGGQRHAPHATHVALLPAYQLPLIPSLAGLKSGEVIRGTDPTGIKEVFVLPQPARSHFGALTYWRDAIGGHAGLIHRQGMNDAQLRGDLIHEEDVGIDEEVTD